MDCRIAGAARAVALAAGCQDPARGRASVAYRQLQDALEAGSILLHVAEAAGGVPSRVATEEVLDAVRRRLGWLPPGAPTSTEFLDAALSALRGPPPVPTPYAIAAVQLDYISGRMDAACAAAGLTRDSRSDVPCRFAPGCPNKKTALVYIQTRSADEPPTPFRLCTGCGRRWRSEH